MEGSDDSGFKRPDSLLYFTSTTFKTVIRNRGGRNGGGMKLSKLIHDFSEMCGNEIKWKTITQFGKVFFD